MFSRSCIASVVAAILLLLGPAVARADHGFTVSKTEAHAGDEIGFQISGTQAGESYIVKVEDQEVASGFDTDGTGVSDKFKMPDFGGADKAVLVEVDVTPLGGDPDHRGFQTVQYLAAASASGGQPAPPPVPIKTVVDPAPVTEPIAAAPPANTEKKTGNKGSKKGTEKKADTKTKTGGSGNGGSGNSISDPTPAASPSSPTATSSGGGGSSTPSTGANSPGFAAGGQSQTPPGPTGPTGTSPVGSSIAAALSPLSGLAAPGKTGFPILLIVLFVLLAALVLTATGPRMWRHWEPALPWGPEVDDEIRLTALGRASASSAELQQTIAEKKASRSVGRSNGSITNGATNGAGEQRSKTPAAH